MPDFGMSTSTMEYAVDRAKDRCWWEIREALRKCKDLEDEEKEAEDLFLEKTARRLGIRFSVSADKNVKDTVRLLFRAKLRVQKKKAKKAAKAEKAALVAALELVEAAKKSEEEGTASMEEALDLVEAIKESEVNEMVEAANIANALDLVEVAQVAEAAEMAEAAQIAEAADNLAAGYFRFQAGQFVMYEYKYF